MLSISAKFSAQGFISTIFQAFLCALIIHNNAIADWNSGVTIEDASTRLAINIIDDGVHLSINITEDAITQLLNANKTKDLNAESRKVTLNKFAIQLLKIRANQQLTPTIKSNNIELKKIASDSSYIEIFFPFSETHPEQLDIVPNFSSIEKAGKKHIITVSHQGLPVIDHGVLTQPELLNLDWEDPWYSHFLNPKLKRDHNDPVMAFLYVEPQQIKTEIVVRVKEMANWTDLGLRDKKMIYPDEFAMVKQKIGQYLLSQNRVTADTKELSPTLKQVDYIRMGAADIQAYEPQQAQQHEATLIGVSITYQSKQLAQKIQWQWKLFNKKIQRVAIRAYDPAGLFDSYVTPKYPIFEWENMLADIDLPASTKEALSVAVQVNKLQKATDYFWLMGLIGFLCLSIVGCRFLNPSLRKYAYTFAIFISLAIGYYLLKIEKLNIGTSTTKLDEQLAKPLLKQLLWNIYQAFESSQEDSTYEKLEYSVSGDLRETLYLQNRQEFLAENGGQSKVNTIEIKKLTALSSSFNNENLFDCEWLVIGDVIHWGHQHRRENFYRAHIKLVPIDELWKISELKSLDQQRVGE